VHTEIQIRKDRVSSKHTAVNVHTNAQEQENEVRVMKIVLVLRTGQI
jgi:hypothetical protein